MAEPAITVRARFSDTKPGGNLPVTRVVIHATAGGQGYPRESRAGVAHATAQYFTTAAAGGSAHYICDVAGEEHCVPDDVVAYHAPPNGGSIGIEICADPSYTRAQWLAPDVWPAVKRAAARARELLDRFKLPRNRLLPADLLAGHHGVCAHVDVSNAWRQSTHWDVGPNFPWPEFMAEVEAAGSTPAGEDDMSAQAETYIQDIHNWMNDMKGQGYADPAHAIPAPFLIRDVHEGALPMLRALVDRDPAAVAAQIPADIAAQVADELAKRLAA